MTIQAVTADGVAHEFPDGTPDDVIDGAIKTYVASQAKPAAPKPYTVAGEIGGAVDRLKQDWRTAYNPTAAEHAEHPVTDPVMRGATKYSSQWGAAADNLGNDVMGVIAAPAVGVVRKFVNKPLAGLTGIPEDDIEAAEQAAMMAFGPRDFPAEAAAHSAVKVAARAVPKPPGPIARAVAPFHAAISKPAAEQQAAQVVAKAATDLPAVRASLAAGPEEIVPGAIPTTFQQTGDVGLGALEREVATRPGNKDAGIPSGPELMAQRRAEQTTAQREALAGVHTGGDPLDVAKAFRQHLDDVTATQDEAVAGRSAAAQDAAIGIGGAGTADQYGDQIRAATGEAKQAGKAQAGRLYDAIDPNKDLTANMVGPSEAAKRIQAEVGPTALPMSADEANVFKVTAELPAVVPFRQVMDLSQHVGALAKAELRGPGETPTWRRLTQLQSAIHENLDGAIANRVQADDAAVRAGTMHPDDATGARLQAERDGWLQQRKEAARAPASADHPGYPGAGTDGVRGAPGAEVPPARGPGYAPGGEGLPRPEQVDGQLTPAPVARLHGGELGPPVDDIKALRQQAADYYRANLLGKPEVNNDLGRPIQFASPGKSLSDSPNPDKLKVFPALRDIAREGRVIASGPDAKGRSNVKAWHYIQAPVEVEGRPTKVTMSVREDDKGHLYYNHVVRDGEWAGGPQGLGTPPSEGGTGTLRTGGELDNPPSEGGVGTPEAEASPENMRPQALTDNPPTDPNQPTIDPEAVARLKAANAGYREYKSTFGIGPVAHTLATTGIKDQFRLSNGEVPGKFFHPGPSGFEHVQAAVRASPDNLPILQDFAAMRLKNAATAADGTIDPARFATWAKQHKDALRGLGPETMERFSSAADAGRAVTEAMAARAQAVQDAQAGAVARVLHLTEPEDVTATIGSLMNGRTAVSDMKQLAAAARRDETGNATAGLKQAVADWIARKLVSNTEVGASGVAQLKADSYQTFMREKRPVLAAAGFSPGQIGTMDAVAAEIQREKRSETALRLPGGSNSAQDLRAAASKDVAKGGKSLLTTIAGALGLAHGIPAAFGAAIGVSFIQGLRASGIERVEQLVARMVLDPAFAKAMLQRVPDGSGPAARAAMGVRAKAALRALGVTAAASAASQSAPPSRPADQVAQPNDLLAYAGR